MGILTKTRFGNVRSGIPHAPPRKGFQASRTTFASLLSSVSSAPISINIVLWCASSKEAKRILCLTPKPVSPDAILNSLNSNPATAVNTSSLCLALYCTVIPTARRFPPGVLAASWWTPAITAMSLAENSQSPHSGILLLQQMQELGGRERGTIALMSTAWTKLLLSKQISLEFIVSFRNLFTTTCIAELSLIMLPWHHATASILMQPAGLPLLIASLIRSPMLKVKSPIV